MLYKKRGRRFAVGFGEGESLFPASWKLCPERFGGRLWQHFSKKASPFGMFSWHEYDFFRGDYK